MISKIKRFLRNVGGNVALSAAIFAMPVLGGAGAAIDYTMLNRAQSALQSAADSAALASAKELGLTNSDGEIISEVAKSYVVSTLMDSLTVDSKNHKLDIKTQVSKDKTSISVNLAYYWTPLILHYVKKETLPVRVSATATLAGTGKICMIGLEEAEEKSIHLTKQAQLEADKCGVYANSTNEQAIRVDDNAKIISGITCSTGGARAKKTGSYVPEPITNCPPIVDPLIDRKMPTVGSCDHKDFMVSSGNHTLYPGTYCNGLRVRKTAKANLKPGIYVISGGKLEVTDTATFEGKNIGLFLSGSEAKLSFKKETTINITAPKDGLMAGILIFEDRSATESERHQITSDNARMLLGTIYLPNGTLLIDSDGPVADKAAYTAIIARAIQLQEGPTLYLNSDYDATDVPVPEGLVGDDVYLSR